MRLEGKTAIITGGAGAIGRATAMLFAQEGAAVVLADVDDGAGEQAATAIREQGGAALYVHAGVTRLADCEAMVRAAETEFGRLDILFNTAGIMLSADGDALNTDEDVWDRTLAVNLKGVFLGCKAGIPALRRAGGGSIINTASFVAKVGAATPHRRIRRAREACWQCTRTGCHPRRENIRVNAVSGTAAHGIADEVSGYGAEAAEAPGAYPRGRFGESVRWPMPPSFSHPTSHPI